MGTKCLAGRALIAEDNFIIAMDVERMLYELGADDVVSVTSVRDALAAIDHAVPDFSIIDLELEDGSGKAVAQRLEQEGARYAFATGFADGTDLSNHAKRPVLQKPYTMNDIAEAVAS